MNAVPEKWQWLFQPLRPATRKRLELCLGVVLSGAAAVALSTAIQVDPSKLASKLHPPGDRGVGEQLQHVEAPSKPKVAPEFAHAVARGDLATMNRLHTPGMPLDGMLALAAESGNERVVLWLLDHGADIHEDEASVDAPILIADLHPEIAALLHERGAAEPNLATAAEANAPNTVSRLLDAHANANPPDATPLTAAASSTRGRARDRLRILEMLFAAGADPNREYGDNALAAAVHGCETWRETFSSQEECMGVIELLLRHGARVRGEALVAALGLDESTRDVPLQALLGARLEPGATATALAQGANIRPREVKQLVAKGVDWAWHDGEDDAALPVLAAASRGERDRVRALLDAGAPVDVHFKDGTCALGVAIDGSASGSDTDYARIVELLISRGANVNRRLPDGRTPLFAAAESGDLRTVTALLDHGARVNDVVLDDTALDIAEQKGNQTAARVLHARGARRAPRVR